MYYSGDNLYCAGLFNKTEIPSISNLARYNTATKTWYDLAGGVPTNSGVIYSIAVIDQSLYIGGKFMITKTYQNLTYLFQNLMVWDIENRVYHSISNDTHWIPLNFIYNTVFKLFSNGTKLLIGGNFCFSTATYMYYHIAAYETTTKQWVINCFIYLFLFFILFIFCFFFFLFKDRNR